jgi:D-inositol-3-phosphate glycosyltransferase
MGTDFNRDRQNGKESSNLTETAVVNDISVALLTGGADRPYVFGLVTALIAKGAALDLIGSDELDLPEFHGKPGVNFLNLRGDQRTDASLISKVFRVLKYYAKLILYAARAKPRVFHILWNNKFEHFDRTLLMLYYKLLRKSIALTVHNVNAGRRDRRDTRLNRLTLGVQYRLADRIFVHTEKMKRELIEEFGIQAVRVTVIPFGINNAVPNTGLTRVEARQRLGIRQNEKTILFFGHITPYKGLEYLIAAFQLLQVRDQKYRLIIAGRPNNCEKYWTTTRQTLSKELRREQVLLRDEFVPDDETEVYFKAADVLVLPYKHIYQSGVLFLGYSFGLPVLAADVGSLKDDIMEGKTGFAFKSEDPVELAKAIQEYFASELYANLDCQRPKIREYAMERNSWDTVGQITVTAYVGLLQAFSGMNRNVSSNSVDVKASS